LLEQFDLEFLEPIRVIERVFSQALAEHAACVQEHRLLDSCKGTIVSALNSCGSLAVEDESNFSEVIALVQKLWNMCDRLLVIEETYFTLTFSNEEEMKSFFILFDDDVVWLLQVRNDILDQVVYEGLITAENLVSFESIDEDMLHYQVL
jgi:hypothetical protein